MKPLLLYIGIVLALPSCASREANLHSGDLLFQVGAESEMTGAITAASGKIDSLNFSHVGILLRSEGADSVLEATTDGGVRVNTLADFLSRAAKRADRPVVVAMRLRDTTGLGAAVRRARTYLGQPYDYSYGTNNGRMYCSELIWASYLTPDGKPLFRAQPMNFRAADGTMPQFWIELFERLGEQIPEGLPGTNPNDLAKDPALEPLFRFF